MRPGERDLVLHRRLAFISFVALAAVTALGGCARDDYYCDATGCYFCDGVGCREVDPPDRTVCRGDFECPEGESCTDIGCVAVGCSSDDDCVMGTECREGWCVAPLEPIPLPTPGDCTTDPEVCDSDLECLDGLCVPRAAPPECTEDGMCMAGEVCVGGSCVAEETTCRFSTECGDSRTCVDEQCVLGCGMDNPCPAGLVCEDRFCAEPPGGTSSCTANADCDAGQICLDGVCLDGCAASAECGGGRFCEAGRCRIDTSTDPFCTMDSDCMMGAVCRNGVCRSPCVEHAECPEFDVSLTFCLEMVCATSNEATSDCDEASDCTSGQRCIDGVCT